MGAVWAGGSGCGGWLLVRPGGGFAAEGDLVAHGVQGADEAAEPPGGLALVVVPAGAEVLIPHAGAGQQLVEHAHLGVAGGDAGLGLAALAGQPPVPGAFAGTGLAGGDGGLAGDGADVPVAVLAAGLALAGAGLAVQRVRPAQEARWPGAGNRLMSTPVSAITAWAARRPQPGMDPAWASCSSYGASSSSITWDI